MKKLLLTLIAIFIVSYGFSYNWEIYGPENIKANKLNVFPSEYLSGVICVDTGIYIVNDFYGTTWDYYSYFNMPVIDVVECNYNVDSIMVVMGNGSYSDGIYSFNLITGQFQVLHYCINPSFIYKHYGNGSYYVGYEDGMLISEDGYAWNEISFFSGKNCEDIQIYNDYIAVAIDQPNDNVFWSEDGGENWEPIIGDYKIAKLLLNYFCNLFGICIENSSDCGYYKLTEYSMMWENKFFTENINTLGFDNDGRSFLGWYAANGEHKGIAKYFDYTPTNYLTFFNQGLPNLNINDITSTDEYVGGSIVFCCTDEGAFYCTNYVGIETLKAENEQIFIYPNPVSNQATIRINLTEPIVKDISISILNNQGFEVDEIKLEDYTSNEIIINWNKGDLPAGVYYLVIKTENGHLSDKFIIL